MAEAKTLNCPMCGAPTSTGKPLCDHCGARLATISCSSCFGLYYAGSKFCPFCGAAAGAATPGQAVKEKCPVCRELLQERFIGGARLLECAQADGIWLDAITFQQICRDREKQAAVMGMSPSSTAPIDQDLDRIRYRPCPECGDLMNRSNFAGCSHIVLDVCSAHGTWFDKDELRRVVDFIRAGGLEKARAKQIAELDERRRRANAIPVPVDMGTLSLPRETHFTMQNQAVDAALEFLGLVFP
jgi:Zn-finger nucleic acid-binding protein